MSEKADDDNHSDDDSDRPRTISKQSYSPSDITVRSGVSEGFTSVMPWWPLDGTIAELHVYMRHYTAEFGGSVGTEDAALCVYNELECHENSLQEEMRKLKSKLISLRSDWS